ncbi:PglZ domain-containing protein [Arthrobacter sp. JZ12]|uniref:alkaline phosphatase family protein n=1 Tax=Arthrobacter sp. JZ12 TaxID=2654190 RepID=UPI002B4749D3|nr:nucleotide pyrophosphatase/phosphodiesterase family protein [Arthrobacter sp. JZ12]WRH24774.1 PglZ domain-containing protein [Arthrobacter sp. JZ12]
MTAPSLHREPLPAAPAYGRSTIAEVFTSSAAALGLPGFTNALELPAARKVCVVLVDGLGASLLRQRSGHAPFLRQFLDSSRKLGSVFPSTTAAALASLGTGLPPGQHGLVGYDVLDPGQGRIVNMLGGWDPGVEPQRWQPHPTLFERVSAELPVTSVGLARFDGSGLTRAALRGGKYVAGSTPEARVQAVCEALSGPDRSLVYLYLNELDKTGHRSGCSSAEWGDRLEDLDRTMRSLAAKVPADTLLLLTADHGMVDVTPAQHIDFAGDTALLDGVALTGGEPRMVHLYLEDDLSEAAASRLVSAWRDAHGGRAWVLTRAEAVTAGLFGEVAPDVARRIGDVLIAAREPVAFYDTRRVPASALEVVGQHGSITRAEREVPLLTLRKPGPGPSRIVGR